MVTQKLASSIVRVTVYRSGARVTRAAEISAGPGAFPPSVEIAGLPLCIRDDSLRVTVTAISGRPPVASGVRMRFCAPGRDEALPPPDDEKLAAAALEVARLDREIERLKPQLEAVSEIEVGRRPAPAEGQKPVPSPAQARNALIEFKSAAARSLAFELRSTAMLRDEAESKRRELQFAKDTADSARSPREHEIRGSAVVQLESPARDAGKARIEVEYVVPGASWAPSYALKFDRGFTRASLRLRAAVCQKTGEDWDGVEMTLSTAEPLFRASLPSLPASRIGRTVPAQRRTGWREPPVGTEALFAGFDTAKSALLPASPSGLAASEPPAGALEYPKRKKKGRLPEPQSVVYESGNDRFSGAEPEPMAVYEECCVMPPEQEKEEMPRKRSAPPPAAASHVLAAPAMKIMADTPPAAPSQAPPRARKQAPADEDMRSPEGMLDYASLRMNGPEEAGRGKLRPPSGDDAMRDMLSALPGADPAQAVAAVSKAAESAGKALETPPPEGHVKPLPHGGFDSAYPCETTVSAPSDGAYHFVPVSVSEAKCSMIFVCVPRESRDAFRFASLENPLSGPVLPGPADVTVGEEYLMTVPLSAAGPGAKLEIGLGVEEGIKVARNVTFAEESSGLLGGRLGLAHSIAVEISNNLNGRADVEVRERIPVARQGDSEVEVHVTSCKPQWEPFEQAESPGRGCYRWKLSVEPTVKTVLEAKYVVRISSKKELSGGNRREF